MARPNRMQIKRALVRSKFRISNPLNWCQGSLGQNAEGLPVGIKEPNCAKWCAYGSILFETWGSSILLSGDCLDCLYDALQSSYPEWEQSIPVFNDTSSHEEVCALCDKAIKAVEGGQP